VRLLDLFCGAGGAAMGYYRAGFTDIVGVDNRPMPRYPFAFVQADALEYVGAHGHEFDVIHASPPCQAYTSLRSCWNAKTHVGSVEKTRTALLATGVPWVIENVPGAPLNNPTMLCGTMFGLGVGSAELRRHRLFEVSLPVLIMRLSCAHGTRRCVIGVYGGHGRDRRRVPTIGVYGHGGTGENLHRYQRGQRNFTAVEQREAMGIDWMTVAELSQAIPPAYCEWLGRQLLQVLT